CPPCSRCKFLELLGMLEPRRARLRYPNIDSPCSSSRGIGDRGIRNDGAEVEHERDFSAVPVLFFKPCYFYVPRRRILPWPNPGAIITMELEEAQMRAVGKLKSERKTGAHGRQRKHRQTKIEGVGACHQFCDA